MYFGSGDSITIQRGHPRFFIIKMYYMYCNAHYDLFVEFKKSFTCGQPDM